MELLVLKDCLEPRGQLEHEDQSVLTELLVLKVFKDPKG
jgi:hypothetical protein